MSNDAYKEAGVDIEAGDALVERIKPLAKSTNRPGVLSGIGGFGGLFSLKDQFVDPVLVSGTDGVGTKLLLAQQLERHGTIGVDLVAMCVNDILVSGAEPLFFLDYFATGALAIDAAEEVVAGIAEGCRQAGCALLGGETAEMPGMYAPGHYDLAGFAVGAVERDELLDGSKIKPGDAIVAVPSTGFHSNGYSLVRKIVDDHQLDLSSPPWEGARTLGELLLAPTQIYVSTFKRAQGVAEVLGAAHITGGGLPGNLARCLPNTLTAQVDRHTVDVPKLFTYLQSHGGFSDQDMFRTFNAGWGFALYVRPDRAQAVCEATNGVQIGRVVEREDEAFQWA